MSCYLLFPAVAKQRLSPLTILFAMAYSTLHSNHVQDTVRCHGPTQNLTSHANTQAGIPSLTIVTPLTQSCSLLGWSAQCQNGTNFCRHRLAHMVAAAVQTQFHLDVTLLHLHSTFPRLLSIDLEVYQ